MNWGGVFTFKGSNDALLTIDNVSDVTLEGAGATLRMRRSDYHNSSMYKPSEHRAGIQLLGARRISVVGLTVEETGGDGVYFGLTARRKAQPWSSNITLDNVVLTRCYRQGMSVTSVDGLHVRDTVLSDTGIGGLGTPPMSGSSTRRFRKIIFKLGK